MTLLAIDNLHAIVADKLFLNGAGKSAHGYVLGGRCGQDFSRPMPRPAPGRKKP